MPIRIKINKEFLQARKEKNILKANVLRIIKSHFDSYKIDHGHDMDEKEQINYLLKEQKQTEEALKFAEDADRADLIEENQMKLAIIGDYLPEMMTEEEIRNHLVEAGVPNMNMKDAMKTAMTSLDGKAEKRIISQIVKELLGK